GVAADIAGEQDAGLLEQLARGRRPGILAGLRGAAREHERRGHERGALAPAEQEHLEARAPGAVGHRSGGLVAGHPTQQDHRRRLAELSTHAAFVPHAPPRRAVVVAPTWPATPAVTPRRGSRRAPARRRGRASPRSCARRTARPATPASRTPADRRSRAAARTRRTRSESRSAAAARRRTARRSRPRR